MDRYTVTGMSCAACSARVEKAAASVPGVSSVAVNLLTGSMDVTGGSPDEIIRAVTEAGYGAKLCADTAAEREKLLTDTETPRMVKRLAVSVAVLLVLMYLSMGNLMFGFPVPDFLDGATACTIVQMALAAVVMLINGRFFINGFKGLIHRAPNMDTLVALGSAASYIYSLGVFFVMISPKGQMNPNSGAYVTDMYFESAAMILVLISVGKLLEAKSKGRTTNALKALMKLAPKEATLIREGREVKVPIESVSAGDLFAVRPGENFPTDGEITEGFTDVDESSLTGESMPVAKTVGSPVYAATGNKTGYVVCRATRVGEDTSLSQIIRMVSEASATKAPIAKLADKVSGVFVPIVMCIAAVTFIIWMISGAELGYALSRGISVLVVSCPCALGLATPVAIMVGNGVGAKNGILFKNAEILEHAGRVRIIALDKTGTITTGEPVVTGVMPYGDVTAEELAAVAASLEFGSEHPIAKAVLSYAEPRYRAIGLTVSAGGGLSAEIGGRTVYGGSRSFVEKHARVPEAAESADEAKRGAERGAGVAPSTAEPGEAMDGGAGTGETVIYFAEEDRFLGAITVSDRPKDDSREAIRQLHELGLVTVMITGDNRAAAESIGEAAGVDAIIANVLPEGKSRAVEKLKELGVTAMVGDGINDAPALAAADIGVAIGSGTDVAIDAGGIVLMNSSLTDLAAAVRLSRATLSRIKGNLFWAFFYNVIGIPIAAGVFIPLFGFGLNPVICAAAMSLSSFFVVTNALMLNRVDLYGLKKHKRSSHTTGRAFGLKKNMQTIDKDMLERVCSEYEGEKNMTKTIRVTGMMCTHCSGRVKKVLEAIDGVTSADVSHESGLAIVTLSRDVADEVLSKAITDEDYGVTEIAAK